MSAAYEFVQHFAGLAPVVLARPGDAGREFTRPSGWSTYTREGNAERIAGWRHGDALLGLMGGPVAVLDVDTKNGADPDKVRQLLAGLDVRTFAEVLTPSGGWHFYVAGHPDLPTVHAQEGRDGLTGYPGVEVLSHGTNVFLPGTVRPKYDGAGYHVMADDLGALADGGDPDGAEALVGWVAEHRTTHAEAFAPAPPWNGEPPDARQSAYLAATLRNLTERIAGMGPNTGRNTAVFNAAMCCGNYIAGAGMDETEAVEQLYAAAERCGLVAEDGERSVRATIRSGLRNGRARPRAVPEPREETWLTTLPATIPAAATMPEYDPETGALTEPPSVEQAGDLERRAAVIRRFPRLDLAALLAADRPPREWVLPGLIPAGASVALVAPAGTGKSLLLLAAVLAVARGDDHFAGIPIPRRRRVLLVDMENTEDDLADRLTALGITPDAAADLDQLVTIHLPPLAPLDTATGALELAAILDAYNVQTGDLIVLDSLQRVINGAENDSDTMRAYYRHTAVMLKRRGLTVVRTDNTGKDTEKGARGTSGKRDDVDVELILTRDAEKPGRMYLKPGKVRLPGIARVVVEQSVDEDGRLTYSTSGDPFRAQVADALTILDKVEVPRDAGERKAADLIKQAGYKVGRNVLRAAIKDRKSAPPAGGAVPSAQAETNRATEQRRRGGAVAENAESERENRATEQRRRGGAPVAAVPSATAPPPLPSKEVAQARTDTRTGTEMPTRSCSICSTSLDAEPPGIRTCKPCADGAINRARQEATA